MILKLHWWVVPLLVLGGCRKSSTSETVRGPEEATKLRDRSVREVSDGVDPREAVRVSYESALALEDSPEQQQALATVAWDAIELDPDLAQEAFDRLEEGSEASRRLIGHFVMRLADEDPTAALEWARGLEDESERSEALGRAAVVISNADPQTAGDIVLNEMSPGRPRDRSAVQVVQRWSQGDPQSALMWAESLESRPARQAGMVEAVGRWMGSDESACVDWVVSVEEGRARSEAVFAVAAAIIRLAPDQREQVMEQFDGELRVQIEARVEHGSNP